MFLQGNAIHNMDTARRLFVPAKFRDVLGDSFVICRGLDECLFVYDNRNWQIVLQKILESKDKESRKKQRRIMDTIIMAVPDKQGRVTLSEELVDYAGIGESVKIIGMGNRLEIWDAKRWSDEVMDGPGEELNEEWFL